MLRHALEPKWLWMDGWTNGWLLLTSVVAKEFNPSLAELGSGPSVRLGNQEFNPSLAELGSGLPVWLNNPQTSFDPPNLA